MAANAFDPLKKGTNVALSNANRRASIAGSQNTVLSLLGRAVSAGGKYHVTYRVGVAMFNASPMFGVANVSQNVSALLGVTANGWGFNTDVVFSKWNNGLQGGYGDDLTAKGATCLLQMLLDYTTPGAGILKFRWCLESDLATVHDLGTAFSNLDGTLYPAFSCGNGGPEVSVTDIDYEGSFGFAVPAGYVPFGPLADTAGLMLAH